MHIFSVDVEDWFHILDLAGAPDLDAWDRLPSRVERNFHTLLELFALSQAKVTCFFLGWIGERFPDLVRSAAADGHEIASHGYAHRLAYQMTPAEFREDASRSRRLLEDLAGSPVIGYRAAGFSCTVNTPWFFNELAESGYRYDSSVFPARRSHGGIPLAPLAPYVIRTQSGTVVEFPLTAAELFGMRLCVFGGGYLRLFPMGVIRRMASRVARDGRPVVFYIHPREIDPDHPRLPMSLHRRFKSYVNLRSTQQKIRQILSEFPVTTFSNYLSTSRIIAPPAPPSPPQPTPHNPHSTIHTPLCPLCASAVSFILAFCLSPSLLGIQLGSACWQQSRSRAGARCGATARRPSTVVAAPE